MYEPTSRAARVAMLCLLQPLAIVAELGGGGYAPVVLCARLYTEAVVRLAAYLDALFVFAGATRAVCKRRA
jgi:hypothetical protein